MNQKSLWNYNLSFSFLFYKLKKERENTKKQFSTIFLMQREGEKEGRNPCDKKVLFLCVHALCPVTFFLFVWSWARYWYCFFFLSRNIYLVLMKILLLLDIEAPAMIISNLHKVNKSSTSFSHFLDLYRPEYDIIVAAGSNRKHLTGWKMD